jgi:DNA-binding transcriptional MerR regulator
MAEIIREKEISIGELSEHSGVSARTVRYYEEIGLLDHPRRRGNKRVYTQEDVRRLKFIQRLKLLGLSLAEMAELKKIYHIHKSNDKVLLRLLELLNHHEVRIDDNIRMLRKLKGEIDSYRQRVNSKLDHNGNTPKANKE